jgi:hypothetical protein
MRWTREWPSTACNDTYELELILERLVKLFRCKCGSLCRFSTGDLAMRVYPYVNRVKASGPDQTLRTAKKYGS